jgi:hypothetical protein
MKATMQMTSLPMTTMRMMMIRTTRASLASRHYLSKTKTSLKSSLRELNSLLRNDPTLALLSNLLSRLSQRFSSLREANPNRITTIKVGSPSNTTTKVASPSTTRAASQAINSMAATNRAVTSTKSTVTNNSTTTRRTNDHWQLLNV